MPPAAGTIEIGDRGRRPAADRLVERVADDLVEPRLGAVTELVAGSDVEIERDASAHGVTLCELADRSREPELPQRIRLDPADDLAQVGARLACHAQRPLDDGRAARDVTLRRGRGARRRASVRSPRRAEPARRGSARPGDDVRHARRGAALRAPGRRSSVRQSIIASRKAIATACVRVSASSFVRM